MRGLVLHSGGLDSTVVLALAKRDCVDVVSLSIAYGQKHQTREITAARDICEFYKVDHLETILPDIFSGFGSTLVDPEKLNPQLSYEEIRSSEGPSPTYVPFRNANLLSVATAVAMVKNCDLVYFGAHADDAHNYAYPDCTPEFIGAMANAISVGTYYKIRLKSPLMWMTKSEIVKLGKSLEVPLASTYSCYEGFEYHCGLCSTCISRKVAFEQSGVFDPTTYSH